MTCNNGLHLLPFKKFFFSFLFVFCLCVFSDVFLLTGFFCHATAEQGVKTVSITVRKGDTLGEIAQRYHVSLKSLKAWNSIRSDRVFEGQELKIKIEPGTVYVVKTGDTLSDIAVQYGMSTHDLRKINGISGDRIYTGQKLKLQAAMPAGTSPSVYVVQKGDALWRIAKRFKMTIAELKAINHLKSSVIRPGMSLHLKAPVEEKKEEADDGDQFEYEVRAGDSLSAIAQRFDVGVSLIRQLNGIGNDRIYPGQKLQLRPSSLDEAVHVVRSGDTLSTIAEKYRMDVSEIRRINEIEGSTILVGQKLRLKTRPPHVHMVERGDALWEIAQAYGLSVSRIKELNGLTSDRIYPGQELQLGIQASEPFDVYIVKKWDYLGRIARLHQMSVAELKQVNHMKSSLIHPGEELKVYPLLRKGREWLKVTEINWDDLIGCSAGMKKIQTGNGPYYGIRPKAKRQRNHRYYENAAFSLWNTFKRARKLQAALDEKVSKMGLLSNALKDWHIVLDPGHGGLDPGAVVVNLDGNGDKVYVVEDEYVYDIALRVYVLLKLHGATVTLTLLSPNHLIRHSDPPVQTFVNEKNEVYNSSVFNKGNKSAHWPRGGRNGNLSHRVYIAKNAFKNVPKNRRIFLSFHADIDHRAPDAPLVLYYENGRRRQVDNRSKDFAKFVLSYLGAGATVRGQNLYVLRNNPAHIKVMLELRNLAYTDHAWALRFEELRQRDAEKVVRGLVEYVGRNQ